MIKTVVLIGGLAFVNQAFAYDMALVEHRFVHVNDLKKKPSTKKATTLCVKACSSAKKSPLLSAGFEFMGHLTLMGSQGKSYILKCECHAKEHEE